jgi:transcriptional regulator with PAS, ATPase and Fis domain
MKIRGLFQRVPLIAKAFFFLILCLTLVGYAAHYVFNSISLYLWQNYKIEVTETMLISAVNIDTLFIVVGAFFVLVGILTLDVHHFLNRVQSMLRDSLVDRQLQESLPHFTEKGSFESASKNLMSLLSLYKTFDQMKSGRIALEMNTLKIMIGHIQDGVVLINQEKVVTHINHTGEQMLKLIPGEIIGQALSRKVSHEVISDVLEQALEYDKKVIEQKVEFKEEKLLVTILPIKDKFGEIVRAVMLLNTAPEVVEETDEHDAETEKADT